ADIHYVRSCVMIRVILAQMHRICRMCSLILCLVWFIFYMGLMKLLTIHFIVFFFSSRRRHTRLVSDWSSDVCSSDLTLLVREVDHRARNALAVVQSIVRLTKAPTIELYQAAVEGRIRALSTAHALLSESRWEGDRKSVV